MRRHVYFYTHLEPAYAAVAPVLGGDPAEWLPPPAELTEGGWRVRLHADGALPQPMIAHEALVRLGSADDNEASGLLRSIGWQSASMDRLVPALDGDLELVSLEGQGCQLSLMGSYRPPLSVIGDAGDRLFGHRVAEACVRRLVLDVAERLRAATLRV